LAFHPTEQVFRPAKHLGGGAAGEGQQQDSAGIDPPAISHCDAMDQRGRFAGACACHDQQRPIAVGGRLRVAGD